MSSSSSYEENSSIEYEKETKKAKKPVTSGIFMTGINLTNVIIGSGIITLPVSFANGGFGLSILLLVISSLFTHISVIAISKLITILGKKTLPDILFATLGLPGFIILSFCQIIYPIMALLSYSIIIADNFTQIFRYLTPTAYPLHDRRIILAIALYGIVFPFALFKNVSFLDKMSFVSVSFVTFYFLAVIIKTPTTPNTIYVPTGSFEFARRGVATALSVLAFAMGCQHCVSPIYMALTDRSVGRMSKSTHMAVYFSIVVYIIIAMCGFICFGGTLNGNMLVDFCDDDKLIIAARITFALTVILSSPLQVVAAREGITTIIYKFMNFNWVVHVIVTAAIISIAYAVATQTSQLGIVVAIAGALAGTPLGFALPGTALLVGSRMGYKPNNATKIVAYTLIIFGWAVTVIGVVMTVIDSGEAGLRVKYWCLDQVDFSLTPEPILKSTFINAWSP